MQSRNPSGLCPGSLVVSLIHQPGAGLGQHAPAQPCLPFCPQGLFSSVVCPGTMLTNLTYGIVPSFVWTLMMPIIWLVSERLPNTSFLCLWKLFGSRPERCV